MIKRSDCDLFRKLQAFVIEQKCIPWRVSYRYQRWMERKVCYRWPVVYRLIRFGRLTDRVHAVTRGPKHHFFGYYDKSPWNRRGHRILAHEVPFNDRPPNKDDSVQGKQGEAVSGHVHLAVESDTRSGKRCNRKG